VTYLQNGLVETSDFNNFLTEINEVLADYHTGAISESVGGFGYGQPINTRPVFVGDLIKAGAVGAEVEWALLFIDINTLINHQSDVEPYPTLYIDSDITEDELITAITGPLPVEAGVPANTASLIDYIKQARDNKFTVGSQVDVVAAALTDQRTADWDGLIEHRFTLTWSSWDDMRYFFNSGGKVLITPTHTPDGAIVPGSIDEVWDDLLNDVGDIVFNYTETNANGPGPNTGTGSQLGFYDLTEEFTQVWFSQGGTTYGSDTAALSVRLNIEAGETHRLVFKLTLNSSIDGSPVTGTMDSTIGHIVAADGGPLTIEPPTYITYTSLSEGGDFTPFEGTIEATTINESCIITQTCPTEYVIEAKPTGALGTVTYLWEFISNPQNDFIISGGQGTAIVLIEGGNGTEPVTSVCAVQCTMTDTGRASNNTVIKNITLNSSSDYSTADVLVARIALNGTTIYNGEGNSATGTMTCNAGTGTCSNLASLSATIAGPDSGNSTTTWQLIDSAAGTFSNLSSQSGLTTSTTATSNVPATALIRFTVTSNRQGGDSAYVDITLDSIHVGSDLGVFVTFPGGTTPSCDADGNGQCAISFTAHATVTGGAGPYTYVWDHSELTFSGPEVFTITAGQSTDTITLSAGVTNGYTTTYAEVTVTDSLGATAYGEAPAYPTIIQDDISVSINSRPVPECSYNRDATGNPEFCLSSAAETATVTGPTGYSYRWVLSGADVDANLAYFGNPGDKVSTATAPSVTTTNQGVTPDPASRTNTITYTLELFLLNGLGDPIASDSVVYSHDHKDITPNITINNLQVLAGTCNISSGTTCDATAQATVNVSGSPDVYAWSFAENPGGVFTFSGGSQTQYGYFTTGPNVDIISDTIAGSYTGKIYATAYKTGQPENGTGTKTFTNTHSVTNLVSLPTSITINVNDFQIETVGGIQRTQVDAVIQFNRNGTWKTRKTTHNKNNVVVQSGTWISNNHSTIGDGFQVRRVSTSSIDTPSGPAGGTWTSLGQTVSWSLSVKLPTSSGVGDVVAKLCTMTIQIRTDGGGGQFDSTLGTISVSVTHEA